MLVRCNVGNPLVAKSYKFLNNATEKDDVFVFCMCHISKTFGLQFFSTLSDSIIIFAFLCGWRLGGLYNCKFVCF